MKTYEVATSMATAILSFAIAAGAGEVPPDRAAQLRAEAAAHERMAAELESLETRSWRDRRWRRVAIRLCHQYAEQANRAANADTGPMPLSLLDGERLPVTAAEYEVRASQYAAQARELRTEADRQIALTRDAVADSTQRRGAGLRQRGGFFMSPQERASRERSREIVERTLDLARTADDIARHYRARARQLQATR